MHYDYGRNAFTTHEQYADPDEMVEMVEISALIKWRIDDTIIYCEVDETDEVVLA